MPGQFFAYLRQWRERERDADLRIGRGFAVVLNMFAGKNKDKCFTELDVFPEHRPPKRDDVRDEQGLTKDERSVIADFKLLAKASKRNGK